jgi:hypothetical protein
VTTTTIPTTTNPACTPIPTTSPSESPSPPTIPEAVSWPDIIIVLDTSADTSFGSNALNDRGFEVVSKDTTFALNWYTINYFQMRMFLANTLVLYKIGPQFSRFALYTFDNNYLPVFALNTYNDWPSLYDAISNKWQYGPDGQHGPQRNLYK